MKYTTYETNFPHHDLLAIELAGAVKEALREYMSGAGLTRVPDDFLFRVVNDKTEFGQRVAVIIAERE